jgi:hypothetical protein
VKKLVIAAAFLALAAGAAHAANDNCPSKIDIVCNPWKYGGHSNGGGTGGGAFAAATAEVWWYSYNPNPCAGLPRLERRLCGQGRAIEGW